MSFTELFNHPLKLEIFFLIKVEKCNYANVKNQFNISNHAHYCSYLTHTEMKTIPFIQTEKKFNNKIMKRKLKTWKRTSSFSRRFLESSSSGVNSAWEDQNMG